MNSDLIQYVCVSWPPFIRGLSILSLLFFRFRRVSFLLFLEKITPPLPRPTSLNSSLSPSTLIFTYFDVPFITQLFSPHCIFDFSFSLLLCFVIYSRITLSTDGNQNKTGEYSLHLRWNVTNSRHFIYDASEIFIPEIFFFALALDTMTNKTKKTFLSIRLYLSSSFFSKSRLTSSIDGKIEWIRTQTPWITPSGSFFFFFQMGVLPYVCTSFWVKEIFSNAFC